MGKVERMPVLGGCSNVVFDMDARHCDERQFVPSDAVVAAAMSAFDRCRNAGAEPHYAFLAATQAVWEHHPELDDADVHEAVADILGQA